MSKTDRKEQRDYMVAAAAFLKTKVKVEGKTTQTDIAKAMGKSQSFVSPLIAEAAPSIAPEQVTEAEPEAEEPR